MTGQAIRGSSRILLASLALLAMGVGLLGLKSAWIAIALYHGTIVITLAAAPGRSVRPLLRGWRRGEAIFGCLVGAAGCIPFLALWRLLELDRRAPEVILRWGLEGSWPAFLAYHILVNPWLEEAFWRGALGSESRLPEPVDFLFAGYHFLVLGSLVSLPWLLVSAITLTGASWFWRQLRNRTGGLLPSALSHLAADASILLAADWLMRN